MSAGQLRRHGSPLQNGATMIADCLCISCAMLGLVGGQPEPTTRPSLGDRVEAALADRRAMLAVYNDSTRDAQTRIDALAAAVTILEELVRRFPDHPDSLEWQLQLGLDLIDRQAEPHYSNILFDDGSEDDRQALQTIAAKADAIFEQLRKAIWRVEDRLEQLSPVEYEKRDRQGVVRRIVRLRSQSEYHHAWARFLHALALSESNPRRTQLLTKAIHYVVHQKKLTLRDHAETGVQHQSLLLAGMASRLLGRLTDATKHLGQAIALVSALDQPPSDHRMTWLAGLARLERIRALRDADQFDEAYAAIGECREWLQQKAPDSFRLELAVALVEADTYRRQAAAARDPDVAGDLMALARRPLVQLARRTPQRRELIYERLHPFLRGAEPMSLPPFERNVYVIRLLREAAATHARIEAMQKAGPAEREIEMLTGKREQAIQQAVTLIQSLLQDPSPEAAEVRAEALFNLAVCYQQRGDEERAVEQLLDLVRDYPRFEQRRTAAQYAAAIAAQFYHDPAQGSTRHVQEKLKEALGVLITAFPNSKQAQDVRLLLGEVLDRLGEHARAAAEYGRVSPTHAKYLDAGFLRLRSMSRDHRTRAALANSNQSQLASEAVEIARASREYARLALAAADRIADPERKAQVQRFAAKSILIGAELLADPTIGRAESALDMLADFEPRFASYPDLAGQALRTRIVAHQFLGQLQDAASLVEVYLAGQPRAAGAVLQGLMRAMSAELDSARAGGRRDKAHWLAEQRAALAQQLYTWAQSHAQQLGPNGLLPFRLQLAEAHLEAGKLQAAFQLFATCLEEDAATHADGRPRNAAAIYGKAEALYRLRQYPNAEPLFHDLWTRTERYTPFWWRALLRSLQCHTRMGSDPRRIVQAIEQQRATRPDLGGPRLKTQFDDLERINRRRQEHADTSRPSS